MKVFRQEQVARVEHLESLWDRFVSLYLNPEEVEDISAPRENEFLALQGSIMQELAAIAELEEGRFALVDEVTSVVNEAISLRHLKEQSEFQVRRRKERGKQVAERIANVKKYVGEADFAARRKEREMEGKLARPFWDPEKGKLGVVLGRILTCPSRFFSSIRVAGEAKKANSFLLALLSLLSAGCVITVTAFNSSVAHNIARNFAIETGILTRHEGTVETIITWLLVCVGIALFSLAGAIVGAVLAHVFSLLMHVSFKVAGGKGDIIASHKVVAFGLTPILLFIILPVVGYLVKKSDVSSLFLAVVPAVALCYMAFLQVTGFKKVHRGSVAGGMIAWLLGMALFAVVILGALWVWHAAVHGLPPSSGKYVYVTSKQAPMFKGKQRSRTLSKGQVLEFLEESEKSYSVSYGEEKGRIRKSDAELREGSFASLPGFLVESSLARAEALIDRLSQRIKEEAEPS